MCWIIPSTSLQNSLFLLTFLAAWSQIWEFMKRWTCLARGKGAGDLTPPANSPVFLLLWVSLCFWIVRRLDRSGVGGIWVCTGFSSLCCFKLKAVAVQANLLSHELHGPRHWYAVGLPRSPVNVVPADEEQST